MFSQIEQQKLILTGCGNVTLKVVYNNVLIKSKTFTLTNEFEEITLEDIIIEPVNDVSYIDVHIETELEEIELSNSSLTRNERKGQVNYFYSNNYEEGPYVSEIERSKKWKN